MSEKRAPMPNVDDLEAALRREYGGTPTTDALIDVVMPVLRSALSTQQPSSMREALTKAALQAQIICDLLSLGDQRLLASDGPVGGQKPDLSPAEWGKVYRACKRILALRDSLPEEKVPEEPATEAVSLGVTANGANVFQQAAVSATVPEGWKLVPVEPTQKMCARMEWALSSHSHQRDGIVRGWTEMLAAAPKRGCTCHPDDNPPVPCPKKYALSECRKAAAPKPSEAEAK